jgi:hypothetical protein
MCSSQGSHGRMIRQALTRIRAQRTVYLGLPASSHYRPECTHELDRALTALQHLIGLRPPAIPPSGVGRRNRTHPNELGRSGYYIKVSALRHNSRPSRIRWRGSEEAPLTLEPAGQPQQVSGAHAQSLTRNLDAVRAPRPRRWPDVDLPVPNGADRGPSHPEAPRHRRH